jgi:hypothetical protein
MSTIAGPRYAVVNNFSTGCGFSHDERGRLGTRPRHTRQHQG